MRTGTPDDAVDLAGHRRRTKAIATTDSDCRVHLTRQPGQADCGRARPVSCDGTNLSESNLRTHRRTRPTKSCATNFQNGTTTGFPKQRRHLVRQQPLPYVIGEEITIFKLQASQ